MHDPHMAAAAGAGLDVPGLSPADLITVSESLREGYNFFFQPLDLEGVVSRVLESGFDLLDLFLLSQLDCRFGLG
ncbi:hypothetical protein PF003_g28879 [Phytophthora fragariae]|nr:hypothetical protein PF003_g28879 [Phytophthora fragariae]